MAGSGDYFEVEQLLKQRRRGGATEYLVQWKGFGEEEQTWEPEQNLRNCHVEIARLKMSSPMVTRRSKTPTRTRSRSRSRGRQPKSPSRSQKRKSPVRTRSRSRSRGRSKMQEKAVEVVVKAVKVPVRKTSSMESSSSRTVARSVTVTSSHSSEPASLAAGDAGKYSPKEKKPASPPVVVPRSLQPKPQARPKTLLERISCQDIFLLLAAVAIVGVAVAHHYRVVDVNQVVEVARQNLEKMQKAIVERTSSLSTATKPPPPTASQTATKP